MVIHDREDVEIIWEVLELPRDESGKLREPEARELQKATLEALRVRLLRLEQDPTPQDDEDLTLLTLLGPEPTERLRGAAGRLRAQRGIADRFAEGLKRARTYWPLIEAALAEQQIPIEIAALPFVESGYDPKARSAAGAVGLWQLMPATARGLGLKVDKGVDERLDPAASTRAAAKMLRKNHQMLGNWPLALTGYNHGPNGVRRAVAAVGSSDLVVLINQYEKSTWGFASKNFYAEFLAAVRVFAGHEPRFAEALRAAANEALTRNP